MSVRSTITALVVGAALPVVLAADANADHRRHWFFDSYGQYEDETFNYYAPRRWQQRRRPRVVYEEPLYADDDELLEEEYLQRRRTERRKRWRKKRIRYDLARERQQRRRLTNVPTPREKPSQDYAVTTDDLAPPSTSEQSKLSNLSSRQVTEPRPSRAVTTTTDRKSATLSVTEPPVEKPRKPVAAPAKKAPKGRISCQKAQEIVAGFGFSDIEAKSCNGKSYDFAAKRDGKPFTITLSSASGELTEV
ncbi:MAG: hypothetical protein ACR2OM_03035, partial [Aestuariivirgaceae bacterium]